MPLQLDELLPCARYMYSRFVRRYEGFRSGLGAPLRPEEVWACALVGAWRSMLFLNAKGLGARAGWSYSCSIISRACVDGLRELGYLPTKPGRSLRFHWLAVPDGARRRHSVPGEQRLQDARDFVASVVGHLDGDHRRVAELAFQYGFSDREIAERIGAAVKVVSRIRREVVVKARHIASEGGWGPAVGSPAVGLHRLENACQRRERRSWRSKGDRVGQMRRYRARLREKVLAVAPASIHQG